LKCRPVRGIMIDIPKPSFADDQMKQDSHTERVVDRWRGQIG